MTTFALQIRAFAEKANANAELVLRKVVLEAFSSVILMSPVDTGRFRGNWQFGVGQASAAVDGALEVKIAAHLKASGKPATPEAVAARAAELAMERVNEGVAELQLGAVAYLSNNVPYARRLEYGWSKQAPQGMVRVTVARWQALIAQALGETSGAQAQPAEPSA